MSAGAFIPIPVWVVRLEGPSWGAKVLFGALHRYTRGGREAYPSIETLCTELGANGRTVRRWLLELGQAGIVRRERTGRSSTYRLAEEGQKWPVRAVENGRSDGPKMADRAGQKWPVRAVENGRSDGPEMADRARSAPLPEFEEKSEERIEETHACASAPRLVARDPMAAALAPRGVDPMRRMVGQVWNALHVELEKGPPHTTPEQLERILEGAPLGPHRSFASHIEVVADHVRSSDDPEALLRAALGAFYADPAMRAKSFGTGLFASQFARWASARSRRRGQVAPASAFVPDPASKLRRELSESERARIETVTTRRSRA